MRTKTGLPSALKDGLENTCPFIGVREDEYTRFAYPNPGNCCYGSHPVKNIPVERQAVLCLSARYVSCRIYLKSRENRPVPSGMEGSAGILEEMPRPGFGRAQLYVVVAAVVLLIVLTTTLLVFPGMRASLGALFYPPSPTHPVAHPTEAAQAGAMLNRTAFPTLPSPTPFVEVIPDEVASLEPRPTEHPTPSLPIPTVAPTQPPTPGPGMETPFGPDRMYLLHTVKAGESLGNLAITYNTTIEVLQAANIFIPGASLWPGTILVILPGRSDPEGVSQFKVIYLEQASRVEELAQQNGIHGDVLRSVNGLGPDNWLPAGRWLIIPQPQG